MATINIRRDVTDPFYRYKMEKLQSKIEGKGNGIKSVVVNLPSVAASLSRPPIYVVKFFGFELGAQTNSGADDRWIINGAHEASKLQDYLDTFITKFVLCKECQNPETDLTINKDQNIIRNCKACGQRTMVDPRHKLSSYIIKNPPKKEKGSKEGKSSKKNKSKANGEDTKEASNSEEEAGKNGNAHIESTSNLDQYAAEAGSDDEFTRRIQAEAKKLSTTNDTGAGEGNWSVDVSEAAVNARAKELSSELMKNLTIGEDDEGEGGAAGNAFDEFAVWFDSQEDKPDGPDNFEIYKKLMELDVHENHKTLQVLPQCLFDENITKQITPRAELLNKLVMLKTKDSKHREKSEQALLGGIERLVGKGIPTLLPNIQTILHQIYTNDIVREEAIKKWGEKRSKRYLDLATSKKVKAAAEPFLKWLDEAEDESEDEEEDDDDE